MERPVPYEEERPWGSFRQITHNAKTTLKIITVAQGKRNSLQLHKLRSEFWIVIRGKMRMTIGEMVCIASVGDEFWVSVGTKHRFEGLEEFNQLVEISFGQFDEDDNERIEDDHGRC